MTPQRIIERLAANGIAINADGADLVLTPAEKVLDVHVEVVRRHKSELLAELRAANDDPLIVTVWTPSGIAMRTRADSPEHAEWLRRMNPKPTHPRPVLPPETAAQSDRESVATGSLV